MQEKPSRHTQTHTHSHTQTRTHSHTQTRTQSIFPTGRKILSFFSRESSGEEAKLGGGIHKYLLAKQNFNELLQPNVACTLSLSLSLSLCRF